MTSLSIQGSELERKTAEKYRRQGYEVVEQPSPNDVPFDLGGYLPDLLVTKPDGEHYLVEIKASSTNLPVERFQEIAEIVSAHPGWRFLLVTGDESMAGATTPLTWEQIDRQMALVHHLLYPMEHVAGFIILWSVLEALMRIRAEETHLPLEYLSTSSLVNHLYSLGELSMEQFDTAQDLLKTRNQVVHGFQADSIEDDVIRLYRLVEELIDLWRPSS